MYKYNNAFDVYAPTCVCISNSCDPFENIFTLLLNAVRALCCGRVAVVATAAAVCFLVHTGKLAASVHQIVVQR